MLCFAPLLIFWVKTCSDTNLLCKWIAKRQTHTQNTETTQRFMWFGLETYIHGREKQIHYMMVNTNGDSQSSPTNSLSLNSLKLSVYKLWDALTEDTKLFLIEKREESRESNNLLSNLQDKWSNYSNHSPTNCQSLFHQKLMWANHVNHIESMLISCQLPNKSPPWREFNSNTP